MKELDKAIISTLNYADIFDYPLTEEEIGQWLIKFKVPFGPSSGRGQSLKFKNIVKNSKFIDSKDGSYFLRGREHLVDLRRKRKRWSRQKLEKAKKVGQWLKIIPWVKMVGVTGSLAILNSSEADDIDILIVCSKGRLWLTRLASVLLVELLGQRRRPADREVKDKICLNMFLDEAHLSVPEKERDLFSAHEVCQLKILWDKQSKEGRAEKFFWENRWVKKYLPNAIDTKRLRYYDTMRKRQNNLLSILISQYLNITENILKSFQLWYMRKRRTTEVISEGLIRFHPHDAREWVLREYRQRLKKLTP